MADTAFCEKLRSSTSGWSLTELQLLLGAIIIGPWALLLLYDLLLYLFRSLTYEIPVVGGRARGKTRPRAPSLTERPSGHRRRFSLARRSDLTAQTTGRPKTEADDSRWRGIPEETDGPPSKT
jgi:hypothetical protein